MYATKARLPPAQLSRAVAAFSHSYATVSSPNGSRFACITIQQHRAQTRHFSSSRVSRLRDYFPEPEDANQIRKTEAAWPHPPYTEEQITKNIYVQHRPPKDFSDRFALFMVKVLRWGTDLATGYKHDVAEAKSASDPNAVAKTKPYRMSERKWLIRFIFLETVAGVPGMVGGMLRHLHSIRRMKRDNGWIETLLEEAYNERMHLLTFLKIAEPGPFMKLMCLGAQGFFFNAMFVSYLISPRTCHRFVGYLEEEAVFTYTLAIEDIDAGHLPKWATLQAPDLAIDYWKMPEGSRTMRDLLLYIRADEAKHREVNHTLGNLKQKLDPNPFVSVYKDKTVPRPGKGIENIRPAGWERDEVI